VAVLACLIAEDFPINQRIALLTLKKIGYTADVVANGQQALEAVHSRDYDVVLMDMHMPEMDGLEATQAIRKFEESKRQRRGEVSGNESGDAQGVHIIALTADAMAGDREKCLAAGMNDYISKPLRAQDLHAALNRFLQH